MRNKFFYPILVAVLGLFSLAACKKDTTATCTPPAIDANIVGTWTYTFGGTPGEVTFNANKSGSATAGSWPFEFTNPITSVTVDEFTYTIVGSKLTCTYSKTVSGSTTTGEITHTIVQNECDKITLNFGTDFVLTKK